MPPPTRKRSRDEAAADGTGVIESSMTVVGENEQTQKAQVDSSSTLQPASSSMPPPPTPTQDGAQASEINASAEMNSSATPNTHMQPPVTPSSTMAPPSTRPPRSAQIHLSQQQSQSQSQTLADLDKAAQPEAESAPQKSFAQGPSRKRSSEHTKSPSIAEESDPDASSSFDDPGDPLQAFDWADLQLRHNRKMAELDNCEREALSEFHRLSQFFSVWASASQSHEVGRSFKRMKTQFALVQHHEEELEQKRQHFNKAYTAFQSALALLSE